MNPLPPTAPNLRRAPAPSQRAEPKFCGCGCRTVRKRVRTFLRLYHREFRQNGQYIDHFRCDAHGCESPKPKTK